MKQLLLGFIAFAAIITLNCSNKALNSQPAITRNTITVRQFSNGQMISNASIKLFDVGDTTKVPVAVATTDQSGTAVIGELENGYYNAIVVKDSFVAYSDSLFTGQSQTFSDTLDLIIPSSIEGVVRIQPTDDPRSVVVHAIGTDKYVNVERDGTFHLEGLGAGQYTIRLSSALGTYTPKFVRIALAKETMLSLDTITLTFLGTPVVTGLSAKYDTSKGMVLLSWNPVDFIDLRGYVIYRSCPPYQTVLLYSTTSNACNDTLYPEVTGGQYWKPPFQLTDTTSTFRCTYRIAVQSKTDYIGPQYEIVEVDVVSPLTVGQFVF